LQAIDLINHTLLTRGDTVIIEEDCYQGSINRLLRMGVNPIGIPLNEQGMRIDVLASVLNALSSKGVRPKYIYTIPTVQNPSSTIMPTSHRERLLQLAHTHGVPIFEDDCYADLTWSGERPPALYAMSPYNNVIHIGSFSKSIAPALRVGFIVAPWNVLSHILITFLMELHCANAIKLKTPLEDSAALELARRSRGTPRIAISRLFWARQFSASERDGTITLAVAREALHLAEVDHAGLDKQDRRYLETLTGVFQGGPAGVEAIAATMNLPSDTLSDEVEPYLLREQFVLRTARGRMATSKAWSHIGRIPPVTENPNIGPDLFSSAGI
jgi:hypothetical protein